MIKNPTIGDVIQYLAVEVKVVQIREDIDIVIVEEVTTGKRREVRRGFLDVQA